MKYILSIFILYTALASQSSPMHSMYIPVTYYGDTTITDTVIGPAYKGKYIKMGDKIIIDGPFTQYTKRKGGTPPFVPDVTILQGTEKKVKD
jgi:hypothetical protein